MTALRTCGDCHKNYQDNGLDVCDNCKPKQEGWVSDNTNRIYIITAENPDGELITNKEVDKWLRTEIEKAEKRGYKQGLKEAIDAIKKKL